MPRATLEPFWYRGNITGLWQKLRRVERTANEARATRGRVESYEDVTSKDAIQLGYNNGTFAFGGTNFRPTADYLKERGVRGFLYYDTDTGTLYGWDGLTWKSTALS